MYVNHFMYDKLFLFLSFIKSSEMLWFITNMHQKYASKERTDLYLSIGIHHGLTEQLQPEI